MSAIWEFLSNGGWPVLIPIGIIIIVIIAGIGKGGGGGGSHWDWLCNGGCQ